MLPAIILAGGALWTQYQTERANDEVALIEQARSLARLVDAEFQRAETVARMLAISAALARGDLEAFREEMASARGLLANGLPPQSLQPELSLFDRWGTRLLDTAAVNGRGAGRPAPAHTLDVIASGTPQISNLFPGARSGLPRVALAVPVFAPKSGSSDSTQVSGAISVALPRTRFLDILSRASLPQGALASLQDRRGITVARTLGDAETVGKPPTPDVLAAIMASETGLMPLGTLTLENVPSVIAFARAPHSGYIVKLDIPDSTFQAPFLLSLAWMGVAGTGVLITALALALVMTRRIVAAFHDAPRIAFDIAQNDAAATSTGLREADELAAALAYRARTDASLRVLFESSPVGVVISDIGGRVYAANDAFLLIVGRTREEIENGEIRWDEITPEEWIGRDETAITEAVRTGRCTPYEKEFMRPDGTRVPVLLSFGLADRTVGSAATFVVDLTERKAAESAARESEARFHAMTDAMPQMVWSTRPDGYHDFYNRRWYELTGTEPEQVEGEGWNPVFHPDDRARAWECWRHSLETGEPYEIEYRLRMADGSYRWMLGRALPMRGAPDAAHPDGRILRWFGTCTDIEDAVAARETLARSREDLERMVEARTAALRETETRLAHAQRMEALGQLAGGIAHDFNNVLQALQGGAALIARRPTDPERVRRLTRMMMEAAARGAAITRRLLAFARRGDLHAEAINVSTLLGDMREILVHTLGTGVQVRISVEEGTPLLLADKGQLETVLVNLATNARDAMGSIGLLTLAAGAEMVTPESTAAYPGSLQPGRFVWLSVADNGPGISPELLDRVTEPFFSTKPRGKGTGLGLSMARGFTEQSGGGLRITSEVGFGTAVKLWFPVAEDVPVSTSSRPHEDDGTSPGDRRARLLLVDDEIVVRETIAQELDEAGFEVCCAADAADALALLDSGERFDLMVTDLSMPVMDGVMLIRRAHRYRPGMPAILLTGFATPTAELAFGEMIDGPFLLLRKPVTGTDLTENINILLAGARPADEEQWA